MIDSKLTTFINAARLKNYTRTAELLNLTQPAVTQHIKQLEEHYGVKLIKKKGRQISLTEEGELLLEYANAFEASSLLLERKIKNKSAVIKRYNIGATLTIGEFVLPGLLGEHKRQNENIDILMQVNNLSEILKKLENGQLDFALVEGPFDKTKFKYSRLQEDELVLAVSPKSSLACRTEVEPEEIVKSGKLIMREEGSGTRIIFENKLLELGFELSELKIYMEIGSIGAIKSLVRADLGYTIISKEAVKEEAETRILKIVPLKGTKIMREFNFVYLDNSQKDFLESFMSFLWSMKK